VKCNDTDAALIRVLTVDDHPLMMASIAGQIIAPPRPIPHGESTGLPPNLFCLF
jgi:hypothetical protein